MFVLGSAIATTVLGILAVVVGRTLAGFGSWVAYVAALIPIVMGLHLLGWIRLPMPALASMPRVGGRTGAFLGGLFLSLVIGPCGTPALAAILSYAALQHSIAFAAALLFLYGLGNGLPLLVVGAAAGGLARKLEVLGWSRWIEKVVGVAMVGLGFVLLWPA